MAPHDDHYETSRAGRTRWAMRCILLALLPAADVALLLGPGCAGHQAGNAGIVPDELIVSVRPGTTREDLAALFAGYGAAMKEELAALSACLVGIDPRNREQVAHSLLASPLVEGVLNNEIYETEVTPLDPDYTVQWFLEAIHGPLAWSVTTGSGGVLVAVLDTGVDLTHPDLAGKLRVGADTSGDGVGYADAAGHGTAVAGIIGAESDSGAGVASVAWSCPILPIRVTGADGKATSWSIAAGIALAVDRGAKIINISFAPLHDNEIVLRQAHLAWLSGSLVVISADNTGQRVTGGGADEVLFVGATDQSDHLASFSTYGEFVDLVAPGVGIYTTKLGGAYGAFSGTSFAAPVVSGVAALVWSVNLDLRPATVRDILLATARDLGEPGWDITYAFGCVDAARAVQLAAQIVEQQDATPPVVSIVSPADGAVLQSTTIVQVEAADDLGLSEVVLYVDGIRRASDAVWPYGFLINPARYSLGPHQIQVRGVDIAGNASEVAIRLEFASTPDTVAPTVTIATPRAGDTVRGMVTILADAADDRALLSVEVLIDGAVVATVEPSEAATAVAHNWNTADPRVALGPHTIAVRVTDTSGNTTSESLTVSVVR